MPDHIEISESTAAGRRSGRKRLLKFAGLSAAVFAGLLGWRLFGRTEAPVYTAAPVERGDVVTTISATGKLQAVVTVQVGSQVSGRIAEIHADFNSRVKKGQIIARLDPSLLQAQLDQARANQANAQARLQTAESAVGNAQASLASAEANRERLRIAQQDAGRAHGRMTELLGTGAVSAREVESAQAVLEQAGAQLHQAAAQVEQARAQLLSVRSQVNEARAQLKQTGASVELASANLGYSIIRAPIDGVVIARNVDVGQTVAASLQAPTLFLIANDLTQMQVLADIDEADVGQLGADSKVSFTVDAYPRDVFKGRVSQIRLNPQTVQNVVTYTAVIDVQNPELKLKPGMTANVTATVAESRNVLKVPNAALRFRPEPVGAGSGAPRRPRVENTGSAARVEPGERPQLVWKIQEKGNLRPVHITPGLTDGAHTEVVSGDLKPGDQLATGGGAQASSARPAARNPMMPFGGRGGRR
jgi:HlyD family secretion protein